VDDRPANNGPKGVIPTRPRTQRPFCPRARLPPTSLRSRGLQSGNLRSLRSMRLNPFLIIPSQTGQPAGTLLRPGRQRRPSYQPWATPKESHARKTQSAESASHPSAPPAHPQNPYRSASAACADQLTNFRSSGSVPLMSFSKKKGQNGVVMVAIRTPEGKTYTFRAISTKQLDPKLKRESRLRAKSMRDGLRNAVQKARERRVPLQTLVPVS